MTYGVTVTDNDGVSSTQPITITITGTNDAPALNADASGPHTITELAGKTGNATLDTTAGTLNFTDVDLNDTHTASKNFVSAVWTKADASTASVADPGTLVLSRDRRHRRRLARFLL